MLINIYVLLGTVNGLLRLTANGTSYYENLSSEDRAALCDSIKRQLSQVIPVNLDRLSIHGKPQYDPSLESKQLLFRVEIKSAKTTGQRSVSKVLNDLKTLILHKSITAVQYYSSISMLDETYGFTVAREYNNRSTLHQPPALVINACII